MRGVEVKSDPVERLSLDEALPPHDLARHYEPAVGGVADLLAAIGQGRHVWLRGGLGQGKTHWLRVAWAALTADPGQVQEAGLPRPWEGDRRLVVPVGGDAHREQGPLAAVATACATAARAELGLELVVTPAHEWLAWADSPAAAPHREAIDGLCRARLGSGFAEARWRSGAAAVCEVLVAYVESHRLPAPTVLSPAEKLADLAEQLAGAGVERILLLADDVDAPDWTEVLAAVVSGSPSPYGGAWQLVAAAVAPAPVELAEQVTSLDVPPPLPEVALGRAVDGDWLTFDEVLTAEAWSLLAELLRASVAPVALAVMTIREAVAAAERLPLEATDLLAAGTLRAWLRDALPASWAGLVAAGPVEESPAVSLAAWPLLEAAAGRGPGVAPGSVGAPAAAQARLTDDPAASPRLDERELRLFRARAARAGRVTPVDLEALRRARLARLVDSLPRRLVWENLTYVGEVTYAEAPTRALLAPLPPHTAFRLVLLPTAPTGAVRLGDTRIVLLAPAPVDAAEREELFAEAGVRAVAAEDPDDEIRTAAAEWLAARAEGHQRRLLAALAAGWSLAEPPLEATARAALADAPPAAVPGLLFRQRFAKLFTARGQWFDGEALAGPPSPEELALVWDELTAGVPGGALCAALRLRGDAEPPGLGELRRRVTEVGGVLPAPVALAELTGPPHGLTPELAKLYLLVAVLRGEPRLELEVGELAARPAVYDRERIGQLRFADLRVDQLLRLRRVDAPTWDEIRPFAAALIDTSGATAPEQRERLLVALEELATEVAQVSRDLAYLAERLGSRPPAAVVADLQRLGKVAATPSAEAFATSASTLFGGAAEWERAVAALRGWRSLGPWVDELVSLAAWLAELRLPADHPFAADVLGLSAQLRLDRLLESPHLARGLLAQARHFTRQYATAYRAAHAEHHRRVSALRREAEALLPAVEALVRLNGLEALGPPDGEGLGEAVAALLAELAPCTVTPEPAQRPTCPSCGWRWGDAPPTERLAELAAAVTAALTTRSRRLRALLTAELLERHASDRLEALHQVLQLQQAAALPEVLTPETVELLRDCLLEARPATVLAALRAAWPTVHRTDLPAVLADFERLLRAALDAADDERIELA